MRSVKPIPQEHIRRIFGEVEVEPAFTKHDAFLLTLGAYSAVLVGLVIAWVMA